MEQKKKREKTPAETRIILSFLSGGKENTHTHAHTHAVGETVDALSKY